MRIKTNNNYKDSTIVCFAFSKFNLKVEIFDKFQKGFIQRKIEKKTNNYSHIKEK